MQRDKIALIEKGIAFEEKNVDLKNRPPEFIELYQSMCPDVSATAKVPIMEHGDRGSEDYVKIIESNVILDYIEDVWGDVGVRLRPNNPKDAAAVRMFNESFGKMGPFGLVSGESIEVLQKKLVEFAKGMQIVDRCLQLYKKRDADGDLLLGADFSQAECMAAPILVRGIAWLKGIRGLDVQKLSDDLGLVHLSRWMAAVLSRPSVIKTTPTGDLAQSIKQVHPEWFKCEDKLVYTVSNGQIVF